MRIGFLLYTTNLFSLFEILEIVYTSLTNTFASMFSLFSDEIFILRKYVLSVFEIEVNLVSIPKLFLLA